jgi:4-diphosphocytidyl-2-C-methyl-D-erythritol kinase
VIGAAPAKINLALAVGPRRDNGKHELVTVFQRIDLVDRITIEPASSTSIEGFPADTIVRRALAGLRAPHGWRVRIEKHVPVAAGLGGGSSDAATALRLANAQLDDPLEPAELHEVAATLGADVPFFLYAGPQLGTGDGSVLEPIDLPQDFAVIVVLPNDVQKLSTASVYAAFDERAGAAGYDERVAQLRETVAAVRRPADLAALPSNDLASSPLEAELRSTGAFRAGVSGAGPAVYGLFEQPADADAAARSLRRFGEVWSTIPAWYG